MNISTTSLVLSLLLFLPIGGTMADTSNPNAYHNISPNEAQSLIDQGAAVVLDIRTPEEFADGHIEGAINIDFHGQDFEQKLDTLEKNVTYVMHCRSGRRSEDAMPSFKKLGFTSIAHLNSGILGWADAKLPLVR